MVEEKFQQESQARRVCIHARGGRKKQPTRLIEISS
jgi:hypothetical protein